MENKRVKIGIFASSPSLIKSIASFVTIATDEVIMDTAGLDDALPVAKEMVYDGVEVIISRRGTAYLLRENLRIPVISFPHRSFDIISGLKEAANLGTKVLLPVFRQELGSVVILEDLLSIELVQKIYEDKASLEQIVIESKDEGCEVVLGGDVTQKIAESTGLGFVEIRTSDEDIATTVEDARSIVLATRDEKRITQYYRTILDAASDAIISLDEHGDITAMNKRAAAILKVSEEEAVENSIKRFIPKFPLEQVLRNNRSIYDQLTDIDNDRFVLNCQPIILEEHLIGAVATIQDISNVMRSEQVIRRSLSKGHVAKYRLSGLVHQSPEMNSVAELARQYAETDSTILVTGETGTGKEILIHGIHHLSRRSKQPFVSLNCAALPVQLLESELFGYEEGAFTGSKKGGKPGRFEVAHKGTIFLDEIDSTPEEMQTRLLRVLQEKEVMRLGGDRIFPVDVRVIAAAGRDLGQAVQEGKFRADLFFRLNVLRLEIPPLRQRLEDIPVLLKFFISVFAKRHRLTPVSISESHLQELINYSWPGNVRQLRNFTERLVLDSSLIDRGNVIESLVNELYQYAALNDPPQPKQKTDLQPLQQEAKDLYSRFKNSAVNNERVAILTALENNRYNKNATARALGISRTTLWRKIKEHGLG